MNYPNYYIYEVLPSGQLRWEDSFCFNRADNYKYASMRVRRLQALHPEREYLILPAG